MTKQEEVLVRNLRHQLLKAHYPEIFIVTEKELCAVETHLTECLESLGIAPILKCGKHGLYFKGSQLVLEVK